MKCPNCGYDNDEFVRFCANCGIELGGEIWEYADFGVEGFKITDDPMGNEVSETTKNTIDVEETEMEEYIDGAEELEAEEAINDIEILEAEEAISDIEVLEAEEAIDGTEELEAENGIEGAREMEAEDAIEDTNELEAKEDIEDTQELVAEEAIEDTQELEAEEAIEDTQELVAEEDVEDTQELKAEEDIEATKVLRGEIDGIEIPKSADVIKEAEHTRIISGNFLGLERELDIDKYEEERKLDAEKNAIKARKEKILREEAIRRRQKERKQRIILSGMVIVLVIILAGAASFFLIEKYASSRNLEEDSSESLGTVKLTPSATATPAVTATATPTATPVPSEGDEGITASVVTSTSVEISGYSPVGIDRISATSEAGQDGGDYSSDMAIDGDETTAWQEGADGNGEGEALFIVFTDEYEVRYINFKLGDWKSSDAYETSNRPREINIVVGDVRFTVEFPDVQTQYCLMLSEDVTASTLYISIESVYEGTTEDGTCISEIEVYGK